MSWASRDLRARARWGAPALAATATAIALWGCAQPVLEQVDQTRAARHGMVTSVSVLAVEPQVRFAVNGQAMVLHGQPADDPQVGQRLQVLIDPTTQGVAYPLEAASSTPDVAGIAARVAGLALCVALLGWCWPRRSRTSDEPGVSQP